MYRVSEEYLQKIQSGSVETRWLGSITTTGDVRYFFDQSSIVAGSGKITRQICTGDDIEIGSTCAAELDVSLYLDGVSRYELYGGQVTLYFSLRLDDGWENVPVGIFTITEPPERSRSVVTIHAYDAMQQFNKDFGTTIHGSAYDILSYACTACNVELGNTKEEILDHPNGDYETFTYEDVTIYTFRDLVGFVASYLCCFAYIGVDGKLYLQEYNTETVREITADWRFDYKPKDYEACYTALTAYCASAQKAETVRVGEGGLTYNMGLNPLLQFNDPTRRQITLRNIIQRLALFSYTPFTATVPCDPALTVGDVLNFTDNHAVDGKLSAITKQVITINGGMELSCAGSDPSLNVLTSVQKQIQSAQGGKGEGEKMFYYDFANAEPITIQDGAYAQIIFFKYVTTKQTHVDFHGEVKCEVDTTEEYDEETDSYTENDGVLRVTYRMGGVDVNEYHPVDTFFDGLHLLNLMYAWQASGELSSTFEVWIKCEGCTVRVERGAARGYIAGLGLAGQSEWDGVIRVDQNVKRLDVSSIIRRDFTSTVETSSTVPLAPTAQESLRRRNFFKNVFGPFTDSVVPSALHRFSVAYNAGEMAYDNTKVSGSVWVLDDTTTVGTVTTPDCTVSQIVRVTSAHSSNDITYVVSFDGGETWWTYASGWVAPDYSHEQYGMVESTMRSITAEQWAEKLNGTIMVRAVMTNSASLTDIQIFTEVYQ